MLDTIELRICKKCGTIVRESDLEGYSYQCDYCDEDLYEFETDCLNIYMLDTDNNMGAEEKLLEAGFEGVKYLTDYSYDDALVGVTDNGRTVYDYELMIEWLMEKEGWSDIEAIEWIETNTLRALPYFGDNAPIIIFDQPDFE